MNPSLAHLMARRQSVRISGSSRYSPNICANMTSRRCVVAGSTATGASPSPSCARIGFTGSGWAGAAFFPAGRAMNSSSYSNSAKPALSSVIST